ncbi:MAG: glycoside-pentoside-hexuronide (GPH):cation symporter [Eubacteriales bacterium]|nr:glycoside-pentoside-hexuronide (GPH):cation symporter [Eubacteriales bacterium]
MKLSFREKAAYGLGAVGKDWVYGIVSGFLLIYFNAVLGISGTFTGILFMCARVFDALNDPIMGVIVEKTNTKMGKFRPWLLIGTIANAIVLVAMFSVPDNLTSLQLHVYISVAYILWGMTYTIMDIPYWSMIPAITESGKDRENISVIARSCAGVGAALAAALTTVIVSAMGGSNEKLGYQRYLIMVSIFFVVAIVITVLNVKERTRTVQKSASVKEMLGSLISNDQAMVVVTGIIIFNASLYLTQNLATFFFRYEVGNKDLYGIFATVGGGAQILSMMTLPFFRQKYSCKQILKGAISTTIFGYVCLFLLSTFRCYNLILLCLAAVIVFVGFGLATVLTTIFLADTVDYGEWKNHQRNESVVFSLQTFVVKLASAVSGLIAGIGIDLIRLDTNAKVQTDGTIFGLHFLMTIIPLCGLVISIIFFMKKYKLDEEFLAKIKSEISSVKEN